jgi:outer membrane protein OmpU
MNNIKKIGLTALAGSLVATSVYAADMTVSGSASMTVEGYSSTALNAGKAFSMGNQLDFAGSGELDNGMTVSLAFTLDQNDDKAADDQATAGSYNSGAPFDSHSVTVSSDSMGTIKFHGEGGSSAQAAIDGTAAGDMWDNFDGTTTGTAVETSASSDNMIVYTLPAMVDDLSVSASYTPQGATGEASTSYAATYTGVEGLSVSYGYGDENTGTSTTDTDTTTMKASYAYGSVTVAYTNNDHSSAVADSDQETTSYKISYTVSDAISIGYGSETIELENDAQDAEFDGFNISYTAGGMTVTAAMQEATDALHGTTDAEDQEYWSLGLSFAF